MMCDYKLLLREALSPRLETGLSVLPEVCLGALSDVSGSGSVVRRPSRDERAALFSAGLRELRGGGYALLILSGGQATRLGTDLPKALLPVSPVCRKTLLQLHLERVKRLHELSGNAGAHPYVFILTSCFSHDVIQSYLESMRFFGIDRNRIVLFMQGNVPCLRLEDHEFFPCDPDSLSPTTGAGFLTDSNIIVAPNGNGAVYEALSECDEFMTVVDSLKMVHVIAIDNCLSRPLDPELVGLALRVPGVDVLNKCVPRRGKENVGVFCMGSAPCIVEYSELEKLKDASFLSGPTTVYGNICDHMLSGAFLKRVISEKLYNQLTYHAARKVVPYFDPAAQRTVRPSEPNGYKLELFIFDVFCYAHKLLCVEVDRDVQFAPVKYVVDCDAANENAVQWRMSHVAKQWLAAAGAEVGGGFVEISPCVTYAGEGLERFAGQVIEGPVYLE